MDPAATVVVGPAGLAASWRGHYESLRLHTAAWGIAAGTARLWLARSRRRLEALAGTGGLVLIGLGVRLAVTGRRD